MSKESTLFEWDVSEYKNLVDSSKYDEAVLKSIELMTDKSAKILEAGCGTGRVVKYLQDKGYTNIEGIELGEDIVKKINTIEPGIKIRQANLIDFANSGEKFDWVLSYGVVEHFMDNQLLPLQAIRDLLKPNGRALITVPCHNITRRVKLAAQTFTDYFNLKKNNLLRSFFNKPSIRKTTIFDEFVITPYYGAFFEYRYTKKQFEKLLHRSGFVIELSKPIYHEAGLFHDFSQCVYIKYINGKFIMSRFACLLNKILSKVSFAHNHMHLCVVRLAENEN